MPVCLGEIFDPTNGDFPRPRFAPQLTVEEGTVRHLARFRLVKIRYVQAVLCKCWQICNLQL